MFCQEEFVKSVQLSVIIMFLPALEKIFISFSQRPALYLILFSIVFAVHPRRIKFRNHKTSIKQLRIFFIMLTLRQCIK